jgi:sec-independent protein translocase protein TatA
MAAADINSGGDPTVGLDNPIHIAFLLILLLLVFGAKRLPEMGRSLGDGMRGFKDAIGGESSQPTTLTAQQPPLATHPTPLTAHQQQPVGEAKSATQVTVEQIPVA